MDRRELSAMLIAAAAEADRPAVRVAEQSLRPRAFPKTPAEEASAAPRINLDIPSHLGSGLIYTARYHDGSADHSPAIATALKVAERLNGATVIIAGAVRVSSAGLPFTVPANTRITGVGENVTVITVEGTGVAPTVFRCANVQQISFAEFTLIGNSRANAYANGAAIAWTGNLNSPLRHLKVENCTFENFGGDYWIYVQNLGTAAMQDVTVSGCTFISRTGNARQPKGIGADSSCIGVIGSSTSRTGLVERIGISNNTACCDYIKSFFVAYRSTRYIEVCANRVLNCGQQEIGDNCGAYALMLYDSSGFQPPDTWVIDANLLVAPRACGIYLAACTRGTISGNTITGQYDQRDESIPKGGVAMNAASRLSVIGNTILDCFRSIAIVGHAFDVALKSNTLDSTMKDAIGVRISGGTLTNVDVVGNSMNMSGSGARGVFLQSFAGERGRLERILLAENKISAAYCCIEHYSPDGSYNAAHVSILANKLESAMQHIRFTSTPDPLSIGNNLLLGTPTTQGCEISRSTQVSVWGNAFEDFTASYALRASQARGSLWGNSFARSSATLDPGGAGETLGATTPTWHGSVGMKVQNVRMAEPDSRHGVRIITGWVYDGVEWAPMSTANDN
jgi:hypothetical protein